MLEVTDTDPVLKVAEEQLWEGPSKTSRTYPKSKTLRPKSFSSPTNPKPENRDNLETCKTFVYSQVGSRSLALLE